VPSTDTHLEAVPHQGRHGCGTRHRPGQPCNPGTYVLGYRNNRTAALQALNDLSRQAVELADDDPSAAAQLFWLCRDLSRQIVKADLHYAVEGNYRSARGAIGTMLEQVVRDCARRGWQVTV
jgi:hypothetical protein